MGSLRDPCRISYGISYGVLTGAFFPTLSPGDTPKGACKTPNFFPLSAISQLFHILSQILSQGYSFQLFPQAHIETRRHPARDPARIPQGSRKALTRIPPGEEFVYPSNPLRATLLFLVFFYRYILSRYGFVAPLSVVGASPTQHRSLVHFLTALACSDAWYHYSGAAAAGKAHMKASR